MTDLEAHVGAEGRDELVKQVRSKIKELGITYIYYQFISVTGRIVGKGIPADHWETIAERGFQLVYGSTANLYVDRHGEYIGYGPESWELVGIGRVQLIRPRPAPPFPGRREPRSLRQRDDSLRGQHRPGRGGPRLQRDARRRRVHRP